MTRHAQKPSAQAILSDLDGMLLDSFEQHRRSLIAALTDTDFDFEPFLVTRTCQLMGLLGLDTLLAVGAPPEQAHDIWLRWVG